VFKTTSELKTELHTSVLSWYRASTTEHHWSHLTRSIG